MEVQGVAGQKQSDGTVLLTLQSDPPKQVRCRTLESLFLDASASTTPQAHALQTPAFAVLEPAWRRAMDSEMQECMAEISDIAAFHEDSL